MTQQAPHPTTDADPAKTPQYAEALWLVVKTRALAIAQDRQIFRSRGEAEAFLTELLQGLMADQLQAADTEVSIRLTTIAPDTRLPSIVLEVAVAPVREVADILARSVTL